MAAHTRQCENLMLTSYNIHGSTNIPELVQLFLEGQYEKILESDTAKFLFMNDDDDDDDVSELKDDDDDGEKNRKRIFGQFIKRRIQKLLLQNDENVELRGLLVLTVAVSCLHLFVQNNFLGPTTCTPPLQFCWATIQDRMKHEALDDLNTDGEHVYTKSQHLVYLYIAKVILLECRSHFTQLQSWDWWLWRCMIIQQRLLSDRCPSLKDSTSEIIDSISTREPLMTDDSNRDIQVMFHTEAGYTFQTYFQYKKAAEHFNKAKKLAGLQIQLTGALGKRTRFQEEDKAQLVLQVVKESMEHAGGCQSFVKPASLPKDVPLDDDTVLNNVKFADDAILDAPDLSPLELSVIMGLMETYRRSQAQERLTEEEVLTYLSFILSRVNNWSVSVCALNLRSKLERDNRRRVERAMMQLEELVKAAVNPASSPGISCRIPLFYSSHVPPVWMIQRDLATLLLSLGCTGDALDVFEKLEMWEDVIACYQKLGKREKAESLIRERLAIEETPALLCYLGDVTRELEPYQRAWELSGHRNARSMRCMGYIYFQEQKFEQAMECFSTSLNINSLQIPVWFTYGCAAMACQRFDVGAKAFRKCVSIDYDNFEAWSNLSTCFVKLQQKKKAYSTLQDALKCNFDNWRLWENNLVIGTDCGEFEDVIRSYHRLLDLRDKWTDAEVLGILTRAVVEKIPDANGHLADRLAGKLLELFGRVTSKITSDGEIWANYAKLSSFKIGDLEPDLDKTCLCLQKAYRCFTQKADWEKDTGACGKIADQAIRLVDVYSQCCLGRTQQDSLRLLSAAKMMVKGALVKIQKQHTDPVTHELSLDVAELCQKMESSLSDVVCKIQALKI